MFVIADIEWVTLENGFQTPTQLAAIRVDEFWNETDSFSSFIRPKDSSYHQWNHVAYTGGAPSEFLRAKSAFSIFSNFRECSENFYCPRCVHGNTLPCGGEGIN